MNKDRAITKRLVQHAEKRGIKGLFITVDAPQLGRREKVWKSFLDEVLGTMTDGDLCYLLTRVGVLGYEDEVRCGGPRGSEQE